MSFKVVQCQIEDKNRNGKKCRPMRTLHNVGLGAYTQQIVTFMACTVVHTVVKANKIIRMVKFRLPVASKPLSGFRRYLKLFTSRVGCMTSV